MAEPPEFCFALCEERGVHLFTSHPDADDWSVVVRTERSGETMIGSRPEPEYSFKPWGSLEEGETVWFLGPRDGGPYRITVKDRSGRVVHRVRYR
jgi:hypothetical protein